MSFLKTIVGDMVRETAQETFVARISEESGVSRDTLNEVFIQGMGTVSTSADPVVLGKAAVYRYIDTLTEGDVVQLKKKAVKNCTCPYDYKDDSKDIGTDPTCPIHGKSVKESTNPRKRKMPSASLNCDKCKGDGCKECDYTGRKVLEDLSADRWAQNVDHVVAMAMKNGLEPEDLQRDAERRERRGDPKAAIYFDAAKKYAKTDVFREDDAEERLYQVIDKDTKKVMSKPSTNLRRLRNRADKLDLQYGAVKYVVVPVKS